MPSCSVRCTPSLLAPFLPSLHFTSPSPSPPPTPWQVKYIQPLPTNPDGTPAAELPQAAATAELRDLTESLADTQVRSGRAAAAVGGAGCKVRARCPPPALPDPLLTRAAALPPAWQPAGALVGKCRTLDQAKAVVTFLDAASGGCWWLGASTVEHQDKQGALAGACWPAGAAYDRACSPRPARPAHQHTRLPPPSTCAQRRRCGRRWR